MAAADIKDIETIIKSTGFYHAKAKSILETSKKLVKDFNCEVPKTMAELLTLRGVARKTANVVLGDFYGIDEGIVVDTHVKRISKRLGLTKETDPEKVEYDLMKVLPKENWIRYNIQIIRLGRTICTSQRPKCGKCFLADICPEDPE